jgi:oxygen-independent coproporphyrinogen III oxidase
MTGLYVHVPFCTKKCHYCDFVIAPGAPASDHAAFLEALEAEAVHAAPVLAGTELDTLYLGGGTPSVLDEREFEELFAILRRSFRWKSGAEITCEANPGDIDAEMAPALKKLGVNRVSLGAQSFHDDTLKKLNRAHDSRAIEASFRALRAAGFDNISLDLMLSLPGEPWERARFSLERLRALDPEHVSIYELSVETGTVFGQWQRQGKLHVPAEEEQLEILSRARMFLKENGYRHYELLNYAKPGSESRHNNLYWANDDTLGLGPGAYSHVGGRRWRSSTSFHEYLSKVRNGDWSAAEDETLDREKKETESFLLALRLTEGVPVERYPGTVKRFVREIGALTEKGLLVHESGRLRLSGRGQFLAETVFAELSC